jgi:hypothetical protein
VANFNLRDSLQPFVSILKEAKSDDTYVFSDLLFDDGDRSAIYNPVYLLDADPEYFMGFMNLNYANKNNVLDIIRQKKPRFVCFQFLDKEKIIKYSIPLSDEYEESDLFYENNKFVDRETWDPYKILYIRKE